MMNICVSIISQSHETIIHLKVWLKKNIEMDGKIYPLTHQSIRANIAYEVCNVYYVSKSTHCAKLSTPCVSK